MPARVSPYVAIDWLLTGRIVDAQEALSHGAISRISEGRPGKKHCASPNRSPEKILPPAKRLRPSCAGLARQEAPHSLFNKARSSACVRLPPADNTPAGSPEPAFPLFRHSSFYAARLSALGYTAGSPNALIRKNNAPFASADPGLILRPFTADDLPHFTAYRSHPDVARYQSWSDYGAADAQAFSNGSGGSSSTVKTAGFNWRSSAAKTARCSAMSRCIFRCGARAELGVTCAPSHQRQGMAHEALNAVIALLFGPLAKHRITAVVDARNLGAAALFGKLGFRREAHWRQNVF